MRIAFGITICLLVCGCAIAEERYMGKTVSEWVELLKDEYPRNRERALILLSGLGPRAKIAVPGMVELLSDIDEQLRVTDNIDEENVPDFELHF